jgi:hypothetical protein
MTAPGLLVDVYLLKRGVWLQKSNTVRISAGPDVRRSAISTLSTLTVQHPESAVVASLGIAFEATLQTHLLKPNAWLAMSRPGQTVRIMAFEVGQSYERLKDGKRAIVAYARPAAALLRLDAGKQEWITSADLPRKWRRYEGCPSCRGKGWVAAAQPGEANLKAPALRPCPTCEGRGRVYPSRIPDGSRVATG